ncbi:MAG: hypothetical protein KBA31_10460 [Alphaproteobacteria bacterium]|nr:hypothetical protein [Alphaproteobacteria bacterium]
MGFIFRTVFWLGLAMVILPPKARLGGDGAADFRDVDLGFELHNVTYGLWALGAQAANVCDTNPQLCEAGNDLVDASFAAANTLAVDIAGRFASVPKEPLASAETHFGPSKKIHARVE